MIKNKSDLKYYLLRDKVALGKEYEKPRIVNDEIWQFEILLRKCEYYSNIKQNCYVKIIKAFLLYKFHKLRVKLGYTIPLNVFGPGLSIAHRGTIVVNGNSKIGENCRIQECTTIGATNGSKKAPVLGNNIFIGSGARIIGDISIPDNVAIGANATVVKTINEPDITIAGTPAKKISNNNSFSNLDKNSIDYYLKSNKK